MTEQWINVHYGNANKNSLCEGNICNLQYPCSSSTSCSFYNLTLQKGMYQFDVFGAQGGGYNGNGGKGGISSGILTVRRVTSYFVFVGAQGLTATSAIPSKTFGGGGSGYSYHPDQQLSSGGGASDVRTNPNDLHSRIIVSGGGGGGAHHNTYGYNSGGHGSGYNGMSGSGAGTPRSGAFVDKVGPSGIPGDFGLGGNARQVEGYDGCGGGGGYYGGNAGTGCGASGGGGSGYIKRSYFKGIKTGTGVRSGHGLVTITHILINNTPCAINYRNTALVWIFSLRLDLPQLREMG